METGDIAQFLSGYLMWCPDCSYSKEYFMNTYCFDPEVPPYHRRRHHSTYVLVLCGDRGHVADVS